MKGDEVEHATANKAPPLKFFAFLGIPFRIQAKEWSFKLQETEFLGDEIGRKSELLLAVWREKKDTVDIFEVGF